MLKIEYENFLLCDNAMDLGLKFKQCEQWFSSAAGRRLAQELSQIFEQIDFSDWKGRFLQVGCGFETPWLFDLDFSSKWRMLPFDKKEVDVRAYPHEIPLASHMIDVLYAPFVLELGVDIQKFIFEVDRILSSMGVVIFIGLNPTGLWRLSRFLSWSKKTWYQNNNAPSAWRLKKSLQQLDYDCLRMDFFYYIPPIQHPVLLRYFNWVNRLSKIIAFYPPGFYLLMMQKKDIALSGLLPVEKSTLCGYNVRF